MQRISAKPILIASSVLMGGLLACGVTAFLAVDWLFGKLCSTTVYRELLSPSQTQKVVIFERNCGATTDFSTGVSVIETGRSLPNQGGNVLHIEGHPESTLIEAAWLDEHHLLIHYPAGQTVYRAETQLGAILVRYRVRP
jgi:hypothetical protein